jgi:regulator of sigma E protease
MNFLLSIVVVAVSFSIYGYSAVIAYNMPEPTGTEISSTLYKNDVILSCEGKNVYIVTDLMNACGGKEKGEVVSLKILRKGEIIELEYILNADTDFKSVEDVSKLYKAFNTLDNGFLITGVKHGGISTVGRVFDYSFKLVGTVFRIFGQLITGALGLGSVGGTVTTLGVTANAVRTGGLWSLLNITALIGVNLAVFNLLPIPALDGSRVLFTTIEWIRKKPINRRVEGIIHTVGFILILLFAVFIDLQQCF